MVTVLSFWGTKWRRIFLLKVFANFLERSFAYAQDDTHFATRSFCFGGVCFLCFHSPPVWQPVKPAFSFVPLRRSSAHTQQSEIADGQRPVVIDKILILKQVGKLGRMLRLENIHVVIHVFCRLLSLSSRWIIVFSAPGFKSRFAQSIVQVL